MNASERVSEIDGRVRAVQRDEDWLSGDDLVRYEAACDDLARHATDDLAFLLDELWRLRKALGYYADREHWVRWQHGLQIPEAHLDRGRIAKAALADDGVAVAPKVLPDVSRVGQEEER